jgi:hypothetical protein
MILYRLTKYYCGSWHDVKENGDTFDFETEKEAKNLLKCVNYINDYGEKLSYRKVSEKEQEKEQYRYTNTQVNLMFYDE